MEKQLLLRLNKAEKCIVDLYHKLKPQQNNYKSCVVSISVVADGEDSALSVVTHENNLGANLTWTFGIDNKSIICTADSSVFTTGKTWSISSFAYSKTTLSVIPFVTSTTLIRYDLRTTSSSILWGLDYDTGNNVICLEIRVYN